MEPLAQCHVTFQGHMHALEFFSVATASSLPVLLDEVWGAEVSRCATTPSHCCERQLQEPCQNVCFGTEGAAGEGR